MLGIQFTLRTPSKAEKPGEFAASIPSSALSQITRYGNRSTAHLRHQTVLFLCRICCCDPINHLDQFHRTFPRLAALVGLTAHRLLLPAHHTAHPPTTDIPHSPHAPPTPYCPDTSVPFCGCPSRRSRPASSPVHDGFFRHRSHSDGHDRDDPTHR